MPGMFTQAQVTCSQCGGRGSTIVRKCPHCGGAKVLDHTQTYTLEVPAGAPEGHEVIFDGEGDESPDWEPGDIVMRVRSRKDKGGWRRKESGLYWKETIAIKEASPKRAGSRCRGLQDFTIGIVGLRAESHTSRRTCRSTEAALSHSARLVHEFA